MTGTYPGDVQRTLCPHVEERLLSLGLCMRLLPLCARQKEEAGQESTQHVADTGLAAA